MIAYSAAASEILCNTRTTSGTVITVPAGKWYTCDISLSAAVSALGASNPTVTVNGTNAAPAAGTVVHRLNLSGLNLASLSDAVTIGLIVKAPDENSITLDFTAGATGTSSVTINGFVFG